MATLAKRSGVARSDIEAALTGDVQLDDHEIESLADELAVPVQAFFMDSELDLFPAIDFRTANAGIAKFNKGTLKAIAFVERISATLAELGMELAPDVPVIASSSEMSDRAAINLALKWRTKWGMTDAQQLEWGDANKLYGSLRAFIENLGVMVMHYSFESDDAAGIYAQVDGGPHTVLINTTSSSKARKLFTLAHEFCHVLIRAEGASNPSVLKNQTEKFCNKFAAYLLAPDSVIKAGLTRYGYQPSTHDRFIRLFAQKLGISQEATIRRMVEMGYITPDDYSKWRSKFNGVIPPGDLGERGGGRSDPLQNKRTKYGSTFLNLVRLAREQGSLDELDVYRLCGLKPKYQNQLFEAV